MEVLFSLDLLVVDHLGPHDQFLPVPGKGKAHLDDVAGWQLLIDDDACPSLPDLPEGARFVLRAGRKLCHHVARDPVVGPGVGLQEGLDPLEQQAGAHRL